MNIEQFLVLGCVFFVGMSVGRVFERKFGIYRELYDMVTEKIDEMNESLAKRKVEQN